MANDVFANGREIACKAGAGKTICAFPDVCFTPPDKVPPTPLGIPIPYPNTGKASDTTGGSKKVKISDKEIGLKNKSCFKKSMGDEAGAAAKKGVVTSKNAGKVYFNAWSMDVKVEGQNIVRHLDLTTNNHASMPGDTPPWVYVDKLYLADVPEDCHENFEKARKACSDDSGSLPPDRCTEECEKAQACVLIKKTNDKAQCCAGENTGHHLVEVHCFLPAAARNGKNEFCNELEDLDAYNEKQAPCVCASKDRDKGSHGIMHAVQGQIEAAYCREREGNPLCSWENAGNKIRGTGQRKDGDSFWSYSEARDAGAKAHTVATGGRCNEECIKKQLDSYHKDDCGIGEDDPVRSISNADTLSSGDLTPSQQAEVTSYIQNSIGLVTGIAL